MIYCSSAETSSILFFLLTRSLSDTTIPPFCPASDASLKRCGLRRFCEASLTEEDHPTEDRRGRGMRGRRWLLIGNLGLGSCLLAGCLRSALPPESLRSQADVATHAAPSAAEEQKPSPSPSDYLVSRTMTLQPNMPSAAVDKVAETQVEKPVEPVEMRIKSEEPSSPAHPADPPQARMEVHPAPLTRPDAPSVQILRQLLEHRPEEEINEQLKPYDPATREVMLLLLTNIAQLEQGGGIARISPRDLAAWTARLNTLTASLCGRSQLILDRMCFCSYIKNFGNFALLPQEHTFFQPGESAHVYVQARNLSSRPQGDKFVTILKGRVEIYDENNRDSPPIAWTDRRVDVSASPRQDFFINFHVQVPPSCPAGLYTMRITVEDWTDAPPDAEQVPERRIGRRTLDFRVGGPIVRPARNCIAGTAQPR